MLRRRLKSKFILIFGFLIVMSLKNNRSVVVLTERIFSAFHKKRGLLLLDAVPRNKNEYIIFKETLTNNTVKITVEREQ